MLDIFYERGKTPLHSRAIHAYSSWRVRFRAATQLTKKPLRFDYFVVVALLTSAVALAGCKKRTETTGFQPEILPLSQQLTTFEAMPDSADNPMSPEKMALGRQLFFDERLSGDGSRSCYSCHVCEMGLTDGLAKSIGAFNKQLPRSSPTLWNIGYHKEFYWDGRSPSLEKQALAAWTGANMGAKADEISRSPWLPSGTTAKPSGTALRKKTFVLGS